MPEASADYIKNLCALIGHALVNLIGAVGIVCNQQGEVLLQCLAGRDIWGLLGGLCELGEALEDTVKREIKEETALLVKEVAFLHLLTTPLRTLPNGD